ncbi:MAG TPA: hypothetical protein VEX13_01410 [Chloroflexia bacterium]|nr:hypothetical protein [Chloroflexia bacterium]
MLAQGDPTAFAELCEMLYEPLVQDMKRRAGRDADPDLVEEAVGKALLSYEARPQQYDPNKLSLRGYLVMSANGDYQNAIAKELRRRPRGGLVYLSDDTRQLADTRRDLEEAVSRLDGAEWWRRVHVAFPNAIEREIISLIIDKVRPTEPYARLLGIEDQPIEEQAAEVKRVKDRITKRLRRLASSIKGES